MNRFRRLIWAGALAGLVAGLLSTALQALAIYPVLRAAEVYESAAAAAPAHDHEGHEHPPAWEPADGIERLGFSTLTNIVIGTGYGLLLAGLFGLRERPVGAGRGALWGVGGFLCFALAPALGLPPALPGAAEAALGARQLWWALTALATAAGLGALVFGDRRARLVGIALLALPHLIGAPHAADGESAVPAELARRFALLSLASSALFWLVLGTGAGWAYDQLTSRDRASRPAA